MANGERRMFSCLIDGMVLVNCCGVGSIEGGIGALMAICVTSIEAQIDAYRVES